MSPLAWSRCSPSGAAPSRRAAAPRGAAANECNGIPRCIPSRARGSPCPAHGEAQFLLDVPAAARASSAGTDGAGELAATSAPPSTADARRPVAFGRTTNALRALPRRLGASPRRALQAASSAASPRRPACATRSRRRRRPRGRRSIYARVDAEAEAGPVGSMTIACPAGERSSTAGTRPRSTTPARRRPSSPTAIHVDAATQSARRRRVLDRASEALPVRRRRRGADRREVRQPMTFASPLFLLALLAIPLAVAVRDRRSTGGAPATRSPSRTSPCWPSVVRASGARGGAGCRSRCFLLALDVRGRRRSRSRATQLSRAGPERDDRAARRRLGLDARERRRADAPRRRRGRDADVPRPAAEPVQGRPRRVQLRARAVLVRRRRPRRVRQLDRATSSPRRGPRSATGSRRGEDAEARRSRAGGYVRKPGEPVPGGDRAALRRGAEPRHPPAAPGRAHAKAPGSGSTRLARHARTARSRSASARS